MNESEHEQNVNWCAAERTLELLAHEMKSRPGGTVGDSQGDPPPPGIHVLENVMLAITGY